VRIAQENEKGSGEFTVIGELTGEISWPRPPVRNAAAVGKLNMRTGAITVSWQDDHMVGHGLKLVMQALSTMVRIEVGMPVRVRATDGRIIAVGRVTDVNPVTEIVTVECKEPNCDLD
jgi:hypothetical protein